MGGQLHTPPPRLESAIFTGYIYIQTQSYVCVCVHFSGDLLLHFHNPVAVQTQRSDLHSQCEALAVRLQQAKSKFMESRGSGELKTDVPQSLN
jgi:hypothetical protein